MLLYSRPNISFPYPLASSFQECSSNPCHASLKFLHECCVWNSGMVFWGHVNYSKFMDFHKNLKIGLLALWGKCILSVHNAHTILIWSPQPLKSILFRIPLGSHFFTNQYNIFWLKSKRVFNHMTPKCKKREGDMDYTVSSSYHFYLSFSHRITLERCFKFVVKYV